MSCSDMFSICCRVKSCSAQVFGSSESQQDIFSISDYLVKHFGIDRNTAATIIITIVVFGAGVLTTLLVDFFRTWYRRKMVQQVLKLNLRDFSKKLSKQAKIFFKTAPQFNFDKRGPLETSRVEISQISSLREIGYDQSFQAFFYGIYNISFFGRKLRVKAFNKLWDTVSSISFWHEKSIKDFDFFLEHYNAYNEKRNTAIKGYMGTIEPIFIDSKGKGVPAPFGQYLQGVDAIHVNWQGLQNRTLPHIIQRNLVLPVMILSRKNQNLPLANTLNAYLLDASIHYENMSNLQSVTRQQYLYYYSLFKGSSKLLKKIEGIL